MRPEKGHRPEWGNSDRSRDQHEGALIEDQSTGDSRLSRDRIEAAAVELLVWGNPEAVTAAVKAGTVEPSMFQTRRPVVEAVLALVAEGVTPTPNGIYERLVEDGTRPRLARWLVLNEGGFDAAGHRLDGLSYRLNALERADEEERLRMRLAELAADLDRSGGIDRVRELIGGGRR